MELTWADRVPKMGGALLLDTSVYLDVLQNRTPQHVDNLLSSRARQHSAVCVSELTHVFGRLVPVHPSTKMVLQVVRDIIGDIPAHRLHAPDTSTWGEAGMIAGELVRRAGPPRGDGHEKKFLNDTLIGLQAYYLGASLLTGNIRDFDYLSQIVPGLRVIFYRCVAAGP